MIDKELCEIMLKVLISKHYEFENKEFVVFFEDKNYDVSLNIIARKCLNIITEELKLTNNEPPIVLNEIIIVLKLVIGWVINTNYDQKSIRTKLSELTLSEGLIEIVKFVLQYIYTKSDFEFDISRLETKEGLLILQDNKNSLVSFFENVDKEKIISPEEILKEYENILSQTYYNLVFSKIHKIDSEDSAFPKRLTITSEDSPELNNSKINIRINQMLSKQKNKTVVKSGFDDFDKKFSGGGFEAGRLYIGTGIPGSGKSIFMLSSMYKSMLWYENYYNRTFKDYHADKKILKNKDGKIIKYLYIYITAENQIYETMQRYLSMVIGTKTSNLGEIDVNYNNEIINSINHLTTFKYCSCEILYIDAYRSSITDIMVNIEKILKTYEKSVNNTEYVYELKTIYIDYLDLLCPVNKSEHYRLELGEITMDLKKLGIHYGVPVVTVTQLNDYHIDGVRKKPSLDTLTESRKKSEHADCVIFIYDDPNFSDAVNNKYIENDIINSEDNRVMKSVIFQVEKNRGYSKGSFRTAINYDNKRIYDIYCAKENKHIKCIGEYNILFSYREIDKNVIPLSDECSSYSRLETNINTMIKRYNKQSISNNVMTYGFDHNDEPFINEDNINNDRTKSYLNGF